MTNGALAERSRSEAPIAISRLILIAGLLALIVPTLYDLARWSWSTDIGAHGPIVLVTVIWLIWRDRQYLRRGDCKPLAPGIVILVPLLAIYGIGHIAGLLKVECLALYLILITIIYLQLGPSTLRRFWFPCLYLLFLITPPNDWIFVATRPIKMALSASVVYVLAACGLSVGYTGSTIQVDGYQLLVATACSGVDSIVGISAIGLLYIFLRRGSEPLYAAIMFVCLIPVAIFTNFVRILALVTAVHFWGDEIIESIAHELAGLVMFSVAMLLLLLLDSALYPAWRKVWARRDAQAFV